MTRQILIFFWKTVAIAAIGVVEGVIGVPLLFLLTSIWFLQTEYGLQLIAGVVLWSIIGSAVLPVPVALLAASFWTGQWFVRRGSGWMRRFVARLVTVTLLLVMAVVWLGQIELSRLAIGYSVLSLMVSSVVVYRAALSRARRQAETLWKWRQL